MNWSAAVELILDGARRAFWACEIKMREGDASQQVFRFVSLCMWAVKRTVLTW